MKEYKILFTGTVGAGKTTAIGAISETPTVSTDVANLDETVAKASTTVGFDFGIITLEGGDRIRLFGTPGQGRFDFMWKILIQDAMGLIILIDNSRPAPLEDLNIYLDGFADALKKVPCVCGIGRTEQNRSPSLDDFSRHLERRGLLLPIFPVDVRKREDVLLLIEALLAQLECNLMETE